MTVCQHQDYIFIYLFSRYEVHTYLGHSSTTANYLLKAASVWDTASSIYCDGCSYQVCVTVQYHEHFWDQPYHSVQSLYQVQGVKSFDHFSEIVKHASALNANTMLTTFFKKTVGRGPYEPNPRSVFYRGQSLCER